MKIDRRKWTMSVEVTGVFRGPIGSSDHERANHLVESRAVDHLLHRALVQMEAAANASGVCTITASEHTVDCCIRLHFNEPRNERKA